MALTTTWKGQLKISLVSFPVRLYAAIGSTKKLALNQLHKQCRSRIHLDTCCPKHGKLAKSEITKGYEYEKGKYITIEQQDLEKIRLESTRTIELIQFVNQSELDPVYIDAAYYVGPDGPVAQEAFRIVHKAMHKTKKVGIGQITMHNREYLVALKAYQKGFLLIRLHYTFSLRLPYSQPAMGPSSIARIFLPWSELSTVLIAGMVVGTEYLATIRPLCSMASSVLLLCTSAPM